MWRKGTAMLGLVNVILNFIQIGIMSKNALDSETGKKIIKKTSDISKNVACSGVKACCQASKAVCSIKNEVKGCLKKNCKNESTCKKTCNIKVCDCCSCNCNSCNC